MNKFLYFFLSILLLTKSFNSFSQGGSTCAAALGSPITIPFSGTGTICGSTNNYNLVGGTCADSLDTQGPDWVYYFCAPTTGTVNLTMNNFTYFCLSTTNVAPFPSISVWQGCPSSGTCIGGSSSQGTPVLASTTPECAVIINVTAGQCYYILISNYPGYCPCFNYSLALNYVTTPPTEPACTNMGFDAGSFAGWSGTYGYTIVQGAPGAPTPTYTPAHYGTASSQFTITSGAGVDPFGGFPVVAPGGGPNSAMLGDFDTAGYGGATLEQTFNVTAANALLTYSYAVVLQDANSGAAPHTPQQQPFYKIEVFDCVGNPIACGQYLVVGGPGIPGFTLAPGTTNVYYKPWTPVAVDLTPYIGSCAKIKFTVGDCSQGGHFAYVYIDAKCSPMAITGVNTICPGTSTTLSAPPGEAAYLWSPGGQTTANITVSPAVATTYTCLVTSVSGPTCTSTLTYPVALYPAVTATSTSQTICSGSPATITATPSIPGGTFSWAPGGQTTPSITVSPTVTTPYTCTYTDLNGCTATAVGTVTVTPLPITTVNSPTVCAGQTANLTAGGATTYTWSAGATSTGVNTATATPAATTTYTVTGTSLGCTSTAVSTVTVNPLPITTVNSPTICAGQTANLTAGGATTYTWSAGATSTGVNTADATPAATTTYTVTGTSLGCTSTAVSTVTVNPSPISDAGPDVTICSGTAATIGTATTAGYTYSWLPAAGLSSTTISNPSITTINAGTTPIVTTYTVTTTGLGCSSTDPVIVTVNPQPVLTITNPPAVCSPGTVNITTAGVTAGSTGGGTLTYWNDAIATSPLATPATIATSGTYYIKVTAIGGCTDIQPVTVTINPVPISNAGPDITLCSGGTGNIGTATVAGYTYVWTPTAGLSSSTISNPTVTLTNLGITAITDSYTVTTTETATGCSSTDAVNVIVDAVATANAGSAQHVCAGLSITLGGAIGGSATSGTWSGGTGTYSPNNTTLNAVYTPSAAEYAADSVTLTLTTNDPVGPCTFASSNVTFYFYPNPVVNFSVVDPNGCPVHCANFTDLSTVGGGDHIVSWSWDLGDGSTSTIQNPAHCYSSTGLYDVTLTVTSNHGCTGTLTIPHAVQVYAIPIAAFNPTPNPATILDPTITLNNQSSSDVNYWHWNFGDGDTLAPNISSPVHSYPNGNPGTYTTTLIVHNADGCYDTVSHDIVIGPEFTFYIPNCFTPNGDGVNDYFFGAGVGIVDYDIWIFDRWGNMIFHGSYLDDKWDGRANHGADVAQQDVYVWKVKLTDVFSKKHDYIGTVTIVK
jgi:gliding motility-associated-like protein